ncbi:GAP family protein [Auritidibacter ignavus]|uniref:GAP family protein n=1 Tax=Auritidibacter ignavus TaxID=678932 RepID=A0AAJ6AFG0_9MICC|nr:GAP family protein [Auritidibacter ignavus]WGH80778.1 GAP family protein [Auritidibacter ignavus]WGH83025.1 GAP family protein [Auritidibacter ignavus]WGH85897.1 GAP family protein [Auritidibacter ignavus]WGH88184.1 GAP family protein [Auritidibacter ignavus]WGH92301.1 GAP family protein [Auritidibacter ignavus]
MIDLTTAAQLIVLALVDSTSFGTLLIPIWLLTAPRRLRVSRVMAYLLTVAIAYFGIGLVLTLFAGAAVTRFEGVLDSSPFLIGQLVLGILLMLVSWAMDTKKARARAAVRAETGNGKLLSWRTRIMSGEGNTSLPLIALAASAVLLELATMLPYLAAIGIISTQPSHWPTPAFLLLGYCLVMILPAMVLLVARLVGHRRLVPVLQRWDSWLTRNAQSTTAWIIGIVGFLLAANAIAALGWVDIGA